MNSTKEKSDSNLFTSHKRKRIGGFKVKILKPPMRSVSREKALLPCLGALWLSGKKVACLIATVRIPSELIDGTYHPWNWRLGDMRVDHSRLHIAMPEQLLNESYIFTIFK